MEEKTEPKKFELKAKDYKLILGLQEDPVMSYADLAQKLDYKSSATVKKRIDRLMNSNFITSFSILPDHAKLGLSTHVIYLITRQSDRIRELERLLDIHPYTTYRARCYGAYNGLFSQFSLPGTALKYLIELLNILKEKKILDDYVHLPASGMQRSTRPDVNKWDIERRKWNFKTIEWFNSIRYQPDELIIQSPPRKSDVIAGKLTVLDFLILYLLWNNARMKQSEILDELANNTNLQENYGLKVEIVDHFEKNKNDETIIKPKKLIINWNDGFFGDGKDHKIVVDKYAISDRYQYLKKNGILTKKRIIFDRREFRLFNNLSFHGRTSKKGIFRLINAIFSSKNPFPFRSGFHINDKFDEFNWWMNIDPTDLGDITDWFLENDFDIKTTILSSDKSKLFPVWYKNFDQATGQWKDTREWIIDFPLSVL
ncbi:MAG: Lrp/AsnC family transcriptional regulator [Candidatus Hodarchaeales archaeon]